MNPTFENQDEVEKQRIHESLMSKALARRSTPTIDSIDELELRERAALDYPTLVDEIEGELPDFDLSFNAVSEFYKSLPWAN